MSENSNPDHWADSFVADWGAKSPGVAKKETPKKDVSAEPEPIASLPAARTAPAGTASQQAAAAAAGDQPASLGLGSVGGRSWGARLAAAGPGGCLPSGRPR